MSTLVIRPDCYVAMNENSEFLLNDFTAVLDRVG